MNFYSRRAACPADEKKCDDGICLPSDKFCNGVEECLDGSDENFQNCGAVILILTNERFALHFSRQL